MVHFPKRSAALLSVLLGGTLAHSAAAQPAPMQGGYSTQGTWQTGSQPTPYAPSPATSSSPSGARSTMSSSDVVV